MALGAWILAVRTAIDVYKLVREEIKYEKTTGVVLDDSLLARVRKLRDASAKKAGTKRKSNNEHTGQTRSLYDW
jgi:hypothetical protein